MSASLTSIINHSVRCSCQDSSPMFHDTSVYFLKGRPSGVTSLKLEFEN